MTRACADLMFQAGPARYLVSRRPGPGPNSSRRIDATHAPAGRRLCCSDLSGCQSEWLEAGRKTTARPGHQAGQRHAEGNEVPCRCPLMHSVFLSRAPAASQITGKPVFLDESPVPFEKWPLYKTKALSLLRKSEDVGIGDTVRRTLDDANSKAFQSWYRGTFGKSCGCARRQQEWNQQYRY